jgi:hypothetical protein
MPQMKIRSLALSLALSLVGCGGSSGDKNDGGTAADLAAAVVPTNFATINSEILQPSCTFSTCHSPTGARTSDKLNLQNDTSGAGVTAYAALVGQSAINAKAAAQSLMLVKPCDAANSFLITKLKLAGDTDPLTDYGARMPSGSPALPAADIQAIADWINRGALQDEPASVSGSTCTITADGGQ